MQLRFVGCGDAFGSGGRANTCFHVTGADMPKSTRMTQLRHRT